MPIETPRRPIDSNLPRRWSRAARRAAVEAARADVAPPRILLAEDDGDMRQLLAKTLRADGLTVIEVGSGTELLDRLASMLLHGKEGFDLIVSDVRMPGKSGLEVLGGLRRSDWSVPVVLITAFGDDELHAEASRLGATLLDKPFELERLRRLIRETLAR